MGVKDKRAIVTGAAQGLGFAIAEKLAADGCTVTLADINADACAASASSLSAKGYTVYSVKANVSTRAGCASIVSETAALMGGVDILVNNAGILHNATIKDTTEEEWDRVMAVNCKGVFFASQAALPFLEKSTAPRIINISSMAGRMGGFKTGLAYSASKGAVIALTMGMARQLAPDRITVNCVCPGTSETDIIKAWSQEAIQNLQQMIPLGRLGRGTDVAAAVAFFASDEAEFITGTSLDVNGGMYMK